MRLVDHPRARACAHARAFCALLEKDERRDPSRPRPTSDAYGKAGGRAPSPASRPWGLLCTFTRSLTTGAHTSTQSAPRTVDTGTQAVLHYVAVAGITRYRIRQRQEVATSKCRAWPPQLAPRGDGPKTGTRQWDVFLYRGFRGDPLPQFASSDGARARWLMGQGRACLEEE